MKNQRPRSSRLKPLNLGVFDQPIHGLIAADIIAIALSAIWLLGVIIYLVVLRPDDPSMSASDYILGMFVVFLPIALIWIGATVIKAARIMREESTRLQATIEAMRQAYVTQSQTAGMGVKPAVERKLDEIVAAQKQAENAITKFAVSEVAKLPKSDTKLALAKPEQPKVEKQQALALDEAADAKPKPLTVDDFIGALNFPENENDTEGFRKLRYALADRESGNLIRAAQDVLTLLSQDGIYMDDLIPDRVRPDIWRKFARGERGDAIAGLGGINDRSSLALSSGRMRSDSIFRDATHHFLREFDRLFSAFANTATDEEIMRLAETRSARAFMLLGRVTGTFN